MAITDKYVYGFSFDLQLNDNGQASVGLLETRGNQLIGLSHEVGNAKGFPADGHNASCVDTEVVADGLKIRMVNANPKETPGLWVRVSYSIGADNPINPPPTGSSDRGLFSLTENIHPIITKGGYRPRIVKLPHSDNSQYFGAQIIWPQTTPPGYDSPRAPLAVKFHSSFEVSVWNHAGTHRGDFPIQLKYYTGHQVT